jgi:hypothetical protein
MALPILTSDLISQFVKITKDDTQRHDETTVYGTIVKYDGGTYVKIDGSELLTPVSSTTDALDGERVTVTIKNHSAIVTGNITSPAARTDDVKDVNLRIDEFDIILAKKVDTEALTAVTARIDELNADNVTIKNSLTAAEADISELTAKDLEVTNKLTAVDASIQKLDAEKVSATYIEGKYATIESLQAVDGKFNTLDTTYATIDRLEAVDAKFEDLDTKYLSAESADLKYANIDFSNIGEAAVTKIFADSGIIKDLIVDEGTITGELVGVTIKGDLIEGGTVIADKLVVKGEDGLYYKLNYEAGTFKEGEVVPDDGLHGSVIVAKSITAEKVAVTDLVAFGATIGGFHIGQNSLYSGVKSDVDNTTRGIYLDKNGQVAFGDAANFVKFYEDETGKHRLDISADRITFGASGRDVEQVITSTENQVNTLTDRIVIDPENSLITISAEESALTLQLQNDKIAFMQNDYEVAYISESKIYIKDANFLGELQIGNFAYKPRPNGSLDFKKVV